MQFLNLPKMETNPLLKNIQDILKQVLEQKKHSNSLRTLNTNYPSIDFASNDYLGFSKNGLLKKETERLETLYNIKHTGSTGSRLISGNSILTQRVENDIAQFHNTEAALIYNSGYNANIGLIAVIAQKNDLIIYDELIHASIIDGMRLSFAKRIKFKHNNIEHLQSIVKLNHHQYQSIFLIVESIYSMDGDAAPLLEIVKLCKQYNINLIIDEAHSIGVFGYQGKGICEELSIEKDCFARIYTYGKALGCHGASIVGSRVLIQYLINFSRSFIYTTALPILSILCIKAAYELLQHTEEIKKIQANILYFNQHTQHIKNITPSNSSIHAILVSGNKNIDTLETKLTSNNFFVKAIKSPTVAANKERIRICLHSYNTTNEMKKLVDILQSINC